MITGAAIPIPRSPHMILRILAIVLTALALVPAGAHIAALPNKIALPAEAYVVAQAVYLGWWLWG